MTSNIERTADRTRFLATRGSALALAQANMVLASCRAAFPNLKFELKIIKTTGDKLQSAPPDLPAMPGTKGLFTKELEVALLQGGADLAVHSLKDLPTDLPEGLALSAVLPRADVRDVLIFRTHPTDASRSGRCLSPGSGIRDLPPGATIATSSTRRQAQLLALRPDLKVVAIRGNVGTRLQKLAQRADLDGLVLAAAGLHRLRFVIAKDGTLASPEDADRNTEVPPNLSVSYLPVNEMLPCVGQGAIGIEGRCHDETMSSVFAHLNHPETLACVEAERSFLRAMGGGCLSPVAALGEFVKSQLRLRAISFRDAAVRRTERLGAVENAAQLGIDAANDVQS